MTAPSRRSPSSNGSTPALRGGAGIAAVAFDFDGTLADTRLAVVTTALQTLRDLEVGELAHDAIVTRMGLPLVEVFVAAGVEAARLDAAVARYRELFMGNATSIALFPGVLHGLQALSAAGIPIGVASSRGRRTLLPLLEQLDIHAFFVEVLGEEDAVKKKPAPELVLNLAQRLRLPPERLLVVGDTTFDIEMGNAAGARTCAVTYGSHDAARLQGARPHHVVDSIAELTTLLELGA